MIDGGWINVFVISPLLDTLDDLPQAKKVAVSNGRSDVTDIAMMGMILYSIITSQRISSASGHILWRWLQACISSLDIYLAGNRLFSMLRSIYN